MTLTETLQLKEKYLLFDDLRAIAYCERRWLEEGRPTKRWQLVNFLEKMLKELVATGLGYPKVLLLRKKEIQRQTFKVRQAEHEAAPEKPNSSGEIPQDWIDAANREAWEKR